MLRYLLASAWLIFVTSLLAAEEFKPTAQDAFVPPDSELELLWAEGEFTEGPALAPDGGILFSDIGNTIFRYDPQTKKTTIYRENSGRANGLMFNQQGQLVACEGANGGRRRISITDEKGNLRTLSEKYDGKRFNSPNDLAIGPHGTVYFTDPRYVGDDPRELDFEGIFAVKPDGTTTIATREVLKPNGILISADGKRAYVADHDPRPEKNRTLLAFDIDDKGTFSNKRELYSFGPGRGIDGMTLDTEGNIYATAGTKEKSGIYIFSPEGKQLALVKLPADPTNCVFGGGSANLLYITAGIPRKPGESSKFGLYRIALKKAGYHVVPLDNQ